MQCDVVSHKLFKNRECPDINQFANVCDVFGVKCENNFTEEDAHTISMRTKSSFVVGRDRELNALLEYITVDNVTSEFTHTYVKDERCSSVDNRHEQELLEGS